MKTLEFAVMFFVIMLISFICYVAADVTYINSCVSASNSYWQVKNIIFLHMGSVLLGFLVGIMVGVKHNDKGEIKDD